jgi:NAD(P)-dependent dehydrogenase (short-subunit alcohol dehydrogenase family)
MSAFLTGGTGFIGRHLAPLLLQRGETVHLLVRESSLDRFEALRRRIGPGGERLVPVVGDLLEPRLGLAPAAVHALRGEITHFYHLAALYDMDADAESLARANVEGTRHALELATAVEAGTLHHVSSIAAAGRYPGIFREDMFEEAEGLDDPYFRTKHLSEALVRQEYPRPWRVYRPGMVIGHSQTGEIDKVDGPYYLFKLIQKLRGALPSWFPLVGIEGGPLPIVPVDFVARSIDHIARQEGLDGKAFHLVDPSPKNLDEVLNLFARAAHAPELAIRLEADVSRVVPPTLRSAISELPPVRRILDQILDDLGIPPRVLAAASLPTRYDCRDAMAALEGSEIRVPPLEDYAARVWDYWERSLDPDLHRERSLTNAVEGKRVLITGASAGIGRATALQVGAAGGTVLLVARSAEKLTDVKNLIEKEGGTAFIHTADLSDLASCDALVEQVLAQHGGIDVLINNAGRSIRRSVHLSYDRFHDFERTMQLNYFGALRLILGFLPAMCEQSDGHFINVSSMGVQMFPPRFSAYVASKAALDGFSRCVAGEVLDQGIAFTSVAMPLVQTEMIAPTKIYQRVPTITPEEAARMLCDAILDRPKKVSTRLGRFAQILYAVAPNASDVIANTAYKLLPESAAARGEKEQPGGDELSSEAVAFTHLLPGPHW